MFHTWLDVNRLLLQSTAFSMFVWLVYSQKGMVHWIMMLLYVYHTRFGLACCTQIWERCLSPDMRPLMRVPLWNRGLCLYRQHTCMPMYTYVHIKPHDNISFEVDSLQMVCADTMSCIYTGVLHQWSVHGPGTLHETPSISSKEHTSLKRLWWMHCPHSSHLFQCMTP